MDLQSQISVTVGMRVKTICPNEMKSKDANGHGGGGETRGGGGDEREGGGKRGRGGIRRKSNC